MRTLQTFLLSVLLISVFAYPQDALLSEKDIVEYELPSGIALERKDVVHNDLVNQTDEVKTNNALISEAETPVEIAEVTETQAVTVSASSTTDLDVETHQVIESDVTWSTNVTNDSEARNLQPEIPAEEVATEINLEEPATEAANGLSPVSPPVDTKPASSELPKDDSDDTIKTGDIPASIEGLRNVIIETLFKTTQSSGATELTTEANCDDSPTPDLSSKSPTSSTANDLSPVSTSIDTESTSGPETDRPIASDVTFNARRIELSEVESTNEVSVSFDLNEGPESTTAAASSDSSSTPTPDLASESSLQNTTTAVVEDNFGIFEETSTLKTELSTAGVEGTPQSVAILQNSTLSPRTSPEVETTRSLSNTTAVVEDIIEQSTVPIETPQPDVIMENTTANQQTSSTSSKCPCGCGAEVISTNSNASTPEAVETSTQIEKHQATEDLLSIESRIEPEIVAPIEETSTPISNTTNEILEIEVPSPETQTPAEVSEPISSSTAASVTTPEPCTVAGNFSSSANCRNYIACTGNATNLLQQELECPERHVFSPILKRCTRDISPCSGDLTPECLTAGGTPDPNNPSAYYWCIPSLLGGFHKYHIQCATNEQFTSIIGRCLPANSTTESNKTTSEDLPSDRDIAKADWKQLKKEIKRRLKEEKIRRKMEAKARAEAEKLSAKQKKPIKKIEDDDDEEDDD